MAVGRGRWPRVTMSIATVRSQSGRFRSYASFGAKLDDYVDFRTTMVDSTALTSHRQTRIVSSRIATPVMRTDPQYANKVSQIARKLISQNVAAARSVGRQSVAGHPVAGRLTAPRTGRCKTWRPIQYRLSRLRAAGPTCPSGRTFTTVNTRATAGKRCRPRRERLRV